MDLICIVFVFESLSKKRLVVATKRIGRVLWLYRRIAPPSIEDDTEEGH